MSESDFWECSPRYFVYRLNGMRNIMKAKIESERRTSWEQARFIAWAAGNWEKGTKLTDVISFDWEKKRIKTLTLEEYKSQWHWNVPNFDKLKN